MKAKKEFILLLIVIIALALYLIFRTTDKIYQLPKIPQVAEKEITKIEISKANTPIVLNKKDNKWLIAPKGYSADTGKVKKMLDVISKLTLTALVSESKNEYLYDLTDEKKMTVKAWAGDSLKLGFEVGRAAPSWHHTFVKLSGDSRVYHAEGNFRDDFDLSVDKLRDKIVLSFDQKEIDEIVLANGKRSITLLKKKAQKETKKQNPEKDKAALTNPEIETTWKTSAGAEVNEPVLRSVLSTLSELSCEKYIKGKKKQDFGKPVYTATLKGAQKFVLSVFKKTDKDAKDYPAISSTNEYPFLLPNWQAEKIMRDPDDLVKKQDKGH